MSDKPIDTAFNPAAPADEQQDAMSQAQQAAMPKTVTDIVPLLKHINDAYEDQQFMKSMTRNNRLVFPEQQRETGMKSVWLNNDQAQYQGEYYEKSSNFNFDSMRMMVDRTPVLSAVIMTRIRQVQRFCRPSPDGINPGFQIRPRNVGGKVTSQDRDSIRSLQSFFSNCGWESNPRQRQRLGRDSFSGFMARQVRDSLVMDSAPIETEYKRNRGLGMDGFYAVDGSTIRLCADDGYRGDDEIFALQVVQGNVRTAYTFNDLIYVPRNGRTDVTHGGYGMSETELLVSTVTGFLNAMSYNQKFFDSNSIPKGVLNLAGEYSQDDLNSFKRYWNSMVRGINNAWTLPVMVSKDSDAKATFQKFGVDVNEIMFAKWMTFLTSIICAIYGISPNEINFESFGTAPNRISGGDTESKLINSKDNGLRPLLAHFEDLFTDYIVSDFGDKYEFRWTGLDEKTAEQRWKEESTCRTVNEARQARGHLPIDGKWGNAPLNPTVLQAWMNQTQYQTAVEEQMQPGVAEEDGEIFKSFGMPDFTPYIPTVID
ncbi:phage portal protein [Salmonella enterica subsp. enterica]|nr:phage portal protein [Salmonella enterica subsp. enterica]EEJ7209112.1 phage portal protein [Salmonella enterica subsp. enterica]